MPPDKRERKVVIGSRSRPEDFGPGGVVARRHLVGVVGEATRLADKLRLGPPVSLFAVPAEGARPGRVPRVHPERLHPP